MRYLAALCVLACVSGCNSDDAAPPSDVAPPADEAPKVAPPADRLKEATAAMDAGRHVEALEALEKLLAEDPKLEGIWAYVEQEAVQAGKAGELLDRLSVTDAIGGDTLRHHSLRAALALAAGRPQDALDAANALKSEYPSDAAVFRARAVLGGASLGLDVPDPTVPADALVLAALADPAKRAPLLETAAAVPGWSAAVLRAELWIGAGDVDRAVAELGRVTPSDPPQARLAAAMVQATLLVDPLQRAESLVNLATLSREVHAGATAAGLILDAVEQYHLAGAFDAALKLAREQSDKARDASGPDVALLQAALVRAALVSGDLDTALKASERGRTSLAGASADVRVRFARADAHFSYATCDIGGLYRAVDALSGADARGVRGLAEYCSGLRDRARGNLVVEGMSPDLGTLVGLAASQLVPGTAAGVGAARSAVAAADAWGLLTARLEARLVLERQARLAGLVPDGEAALQSLGEIVDTPALQMEVYARQVIRGDTAAVPPAAVAGEAPAVAAWRGFAGTPAAGIGGVGAWARARSLLASGDAAAAFTEYAAAVTAMPVQRQGMWAPLLALDGADGPGLKVDMDLAGKLGTDEAAQVLVALHEFAHTAELGRLYGRFGMDVTDALASEPARALRIAFARERAQELLWLTGQGAWPGEAQAAVSTAFAEKSCLGATKAPPTLEALRQKFPETAIFSVHMEGTSGQIVLVTPTLTKVYSSSDGRRLRSLMGDYRTALLNGMAFTGRRTTPNAGDRLRSLVVDPVGDDLTGIARYLFVTDPELLVAPWPSLPEQMEGRRYLADIRTISTSAVLGPLLEDYVPPAEGYKPDFFGIGRSPEEPASEEVPVAAASDEVSQTMEAAGLKNPTELTALARLFGGGFSEVREGKDARKEGFVQDTLRARYVHIAGVTAGADGGFIWEDSSSSLGQVLCGGIRSKLVVISEAVDPYQQIARAHALLSGGAMGVVVSMWNTPPNVRTRFLSAFYDALNRDRTPARALAEAREALIGDAAKAPEGTSDYDDPSYWGGYLLIGSP